MQAIPQNIEPDRIEGLHSIEGVAYMVGKPAEDLLEIEPVGEARAFHQANGGGGYYFVDTKGASCSCPSFRFGTGLIEGQCKHLKAVARKQEASIGDRPRPLTLCPPGKANFAVAPI